MKIEMDSCTNAKARCNALIQKRGKGRLLTWAMTIYSSPKNATMTNAKFGSERVKDVLREQKKAPKFCPYRLEEEGG
jgi:hypothetical protein